MILKCLLDYSCITHEGSTPRENVPWLLSKGGAEGLRYKGRLAKKLKRGSMTLVGKLKIGVYSRIFPGPRTFQGRGGSQVPKSQVAFRHTFISQPPSRGRGSSACALSACARGLRTRGPRLHPSWSKSSPSSKFHIHHLHPVFLNTTRMFFMISLQIGLSFPGKTQVYYTHFARRARVRMLP